MTHYHAVTICADGDKRIWSHSFRTRQHAHQRARAAIPEAETVKAVACWSARCGTLHIHERICPRNCGAQRRLVGF